MPEDGKTRVYRGWERGSEKHRNIVYQRDLVQSEAGRREVTTVEIHIKFTSNVID